jgi:hypothetical protein
LTGGAVTYHENLSGWLEFKQDASKTWSKHINIELICTDCNVLLIYPSSNTSTNNIQNFSSTGKSKVKVKWSHYMPWTRLGWDKV